MTTPLTRRTNAEIAQDLIKKWDLDDVDGSEFRHLQRIQEALDTKDAECAAEIERIKSGRLLSIGEDNKVHILECENCSKLQAELQEARGGIAALKKEIHDFRSIDRHKDKDWGKWYRCYHDKVDEVAALTAQRNELVCAARMVSATEPLKWQDDSNGPGDWTCTFCYEKADCYWEKGNPVYPKDFVHGKDCGWVLSKAVLNKPPTKDKDTRS